MVEHTVRGLDNLWMRTLHPHPVASRGNFVYVKLLGRVFRVQK